MRPSELKYEVERRGDEPYFFGRQTMRYFGDTMRNFGVRAVIIRTHYDAKGRWQKEGVLREAWELYRKHPVKGGLKSSHYFDRQTFETIHPIS